MALISMLFGFNGNPRRMPWVFSALVEMALASFYLWSVCISIFASTIIRLFGLKPPSFLTRQFYSGATSNPSNNKEKFEALLCKFHADKLFLLRRFILNEGLAHTHALCEDCMLLNCYSIEMNHTVNSNQDKRFQSDNSLNVTDCQICLLKRQIELQGELISDCRSSGCSWEYGSEHLSKRHVHFECSSCKEPIRRKADTIELAEKQLAEDFRPDSEKQCMATYVQGFPALSVGAESGPSGTASPKDHNIEEQEKIILKDIPLFEISAISNNPQTFDQTGSVGEAQTSEGGLPGNICDEFVQAESILEEDHTKALDEKPRMHAQKNESDIVKELKEVIEGEKKAYSALLLELEQEKNASAIARRETAAMISRLQEEKVALQMESLCKEYSGTAPSKDHAIEEHEIIILRDIPLIDINAISGDSQPFDQTGSQANAQTSIGELPNSISESFVQAESRLEEDHLKTLNEKSHIQVPKSESVVIKELKEVLKAEREAYSALLMDLEEERKAFASSETTAMISRLQEEKAALQMKLLSKESSGTALSKDCVIEEQESSALGGIPLIDINAISNDIQPFDQMRGDGEAQTSTGELPISIGQKFVQAERISEEDHTNSFDDKPQIQKKESNIINGLNDVIEVEREAYSALLMELKEERNASAIAASETTAMISRLQQENAALQIKLLSKESSITAPSEDHAIEEQESSPLKDIPLIDITEISNDSQPFHQTCSDRDTQTSAGELPISISEKFVQADSISEEDHSKVLDEKPAVLAQKNESDKIKELKEVIEADREAYSALLMELEEERNASAIAASETMAMISRLQEEKATLQMESRQFKRMVEEKAAFDQEAIALLKEILRKREEEKFALEKEVELYRSRLLDRRFPKGKHQRSKRNEVEKHYGNDKLGSSANGVITEAHEDSSFDNIPAENGTSVENGVKIKPLKDSRSWETENLTEGGLSKRHKLFLPFNSGKNLLAAFETVGSKPRGSNTSKECETVEGNNDFQQEAPSPNLNNHEIILDSPISTNTSLDPQSAGESIPSSCKDIVHTENGFLSEPCTNSTFEFKGDWPAVELPLRVNANSMPKDAAISSFQVSDAKYEELSEEPRVSAEYIGLAELPPVHSWEHSFSFSGRHQEVNKSYEVKFSEESPDLLDKEIRRNSSLFELNDIRVQYMDKDNDDTSDLDSFSSDDEHTQGTSASDRRTASMVRRDNQRMVVQEQVKKLTSRLQILENDRQSMKNIMGNLGPETPKMQFFPNMELQLKQLFGFEKTTISK